MDDWVYGRQDEDEIEYEEPPVDLQKKILILERLVRRLYDHGGYQITRYYDGVCYLDRNGDSTEIDPDEADVIEVW